VLSPVAVLAPTGEPVELAWSRTMRKTPAGGGSVVECTVHKLVADVTLVAQHRVLFVRYRDTSGYDGQTGWFLPDDYLVHLEHPNDAALRIVSDQTGIAGAEPRLVEIESFNGDTWHLVFHYLAAVDDPSAVAAVGNVAAAEWFPLDALPTASEVAHHGWCLDTLARILEQPSL
jgi:ADP-ribose pyrophosphatase YjhB (NUDIX family)